MAGPLSTDEIEDVVSSVRRLVSNEQRPRVVSRDLAGDRLVLTPSLRIVPDSQAQAPVPAPTPLPLAPLILSVQVEEPRPLAVAVPEEAPHLVEAEWEDQIWSEPEAPLAEMALGAEEAEYVASAAAVTADLVVADDPWADTEVDWVAQEPVAFVPLRRRAEAFSAKPTEPTEVAAQPTAAEPPAPPPEPVPPVELAAEVAETQPEPQRMPTEILDVDGTPLAVLDEAGLQAIVQLMIREELQGALGERITRNVRKLVRAEINRALAARELE
jgi:hypothetical protein